MSVCLSPSVFRMIFELREGNETGGSVNTRASSWFGMHLVSATDMITWIEIVGNLD